MMSTQDYLDQYYLHHTRFAECCGLRVADIEQLMTAQLIPAPSYTVSDIGQCRSVVFGELGDPNLGLELKSGTYFHPALVAWTKYAFNILSKHGDEQAKRIVNARFYEEFTLALAIENHGTYRLPDCFDDAGIAIPAGIEQRINTNWQHFVNGVFSLCVAKPDSIANIVHKEILQEKLTALSGNGKRTNYKGENLSALHQLIDDYANSAMPFSPIEFPKSSRKRLVDDVRKALLDAQQGTHATHQ